MRTRPRFLLAIGWMIIGLGTVSTATGADDVVAKVTEAWQRRTTAIQRVRYRMSGTATYMQGSLCPPGHHEMPTEDPSPVGYPEKDRSIPVGLVWLVDLPEGRFRKETKEISDRMEQHVDAALECRGACRIEELGQRERIEVRDR